MQESIFPAGIGEPALQGILETFSRRLNYLLAKSDKFPPLSAGLYQSLATKYSSTKQQAFRWCNAEAVPNPAILLRMAKDFDTTVDWLLGTGSDTFSKPEVSVPDGIALPVYKVKNASETGGLNADSFVLASNFHVPKSSLLSGRPYAFVSNWSAASDPNFQVGDVLLVNLAIQAIEDGGIYLIRTASTTSIRRAFFEREAGGIRFERKTPVNTFSTLYPVLEVLYNREQRFEVNIRQPGVLVIGKIDGYMRSLLDSIPSLL